MENAERWYLAGVVLVGVLIRVFLLTAHELPETDGVYYISLGENLFSGKGYVDIEGNLNTNLTPGFPVLIGLFSRVVSGELAARLISVLAGIGLIFVVYALGKRVYSRVAGLIAAGIVAVYPVLAYASTLTYNDMVFAFLIILNAWILFVMRDHVKQFRDEKKVYFLVLLLGVVGALGYVVRPEGFVYALIVLLGVVLWCCEKKVSVQRSVVYCVLLVLGFVVVAFPYIAFVHEHTGEWTLSTKARFTYLQREYEVFSPEYEKNMFSLSSDKSRIALNPYNQTFTNTGISDVIASRPEGFVVRYVKNVWKEVNYVLPSVIPLPLMVLALFGFFGTRWSSKRLRGEVILLLMIAYLLLLNPVFWVEERYLLPLLPIFALWLGLGVLALEKAIKYRWDYRVLSVILMVVLAASNALVPFLVVNDSFEKLDPPVEHKAAGLWLREQGEDPVVMARKPWVAFYAQGRYVYLPYASYQDTMEYACKNGVDFFVASERYLGRLRPSLAFLLDEKRVPEELSLVYESESDKKRILVYEVKKDACDQKV